MEKTKMEINKEPYDGGSEGTAAVQCFFFYDV